MVELLATALTEGAAPAVTPDWGRIALSLVAVIALIAVLSVVLRLLRGRIANSGALSLEASLPLGRHERVVVVRVGNNRLLLGVTAQQVATLAKLPDAPVAAPVQARRWPWPAQGKNS